MPVTALHRPAWADACPLFGRRAAHTWADEVEPFYLDVVRDLGSPFLPATQALDLAAVFAAEPAAPLTPVVVAGVATAVPVTEPIERVVTPTKALPLPLTGKGGRGRRAPKRVPA